MHHAGVARTFWRPDRAFLVPVGGCIARYHATAGLPCRALDATECERSTGFAVGWARAAAASPLWDPRQVDLGTPHCRNVADPRLNPSSAMSRPPQAAAAMAARPRERGTRYFAVFAAAFAACFVARTFVSDSESTMSATE